MKVHRAIIRTQVGILLMIMGMASCNSNSSKAKGPPPDNGQTPVPIPATSPTPELTVPTIKVDNGTGYWQINSLNIGDYLKGADIADLEISQLAGPSMEYKLNTDGRLYYLSPEEQYTDTESVLQLTKKSSGDAVKLSFRWTARLSDSLSLIEEGGSQTLAKGEPVILHGLTAGGEINLSSPKTFSYEIKTDFEPDPSLIEVSLFKGKEALKVTDWFHYESATRTIEFDKQKWSTLSDALKTYKKIVLSFSISSRYNKDTIGFEQTLTAADGIISIEILDNAGKELSLPKETRFLVRGFNSGFTALASPDTAGKLSVSGLPADTYEVTEVILGSGKPLMGFAVLPGPDSKAVLTITKKDSIGTDSEPRSMTRTRLIIDERKTEQRPYRDGDGIVPGNPFESISPPATDRILRDVTEGIYKATATSEYEGVLREVPVHFKIPQGTKQVSLVLSVKTAEFPQYTKAQSQYNDVWNYDISLPASLGRIFNSGKVNQTHANTGLITVEKCLDVETAAQSADLFIDGSIGAQNVADGAYPTSVSVEITVGCGDLVVSAFDGKAETGAGLLTIYPRKAASNESTPDGNIAGQYLSLPFAAKLPDRFGLPATVLYTPANAEITEVELLQRSGGALVSLGNDYLGQADGSQPGKLLFQGLKLNPVSLQLVESMELVVRLKGRLEDKEVESNLLPLTIDRRFTSFTPLYLASELGLNLKRFGDHSEAGGDSWGTITALSWLKNNAVSLNDISAANVAQTSDRRSILGHSGHSDGRQLDLKYWDEKGGYEGILSAGTPIASLAKDAQLEAGAASHPRLDSLVEWAKINRKKLTAISSDASIRRIYVGNDFVAQILVHGKFPDSDSNIPGLGSWSDKSAKIMTLANHLDHWHVNLR